MIHLNPPGGGGLLSTLNASLPREVCRILRTPLPLPPENPQSSTTAAVRRRRAPGSSNSHSSPGSWAQAVIGRLPPTYMLNAAAGHWILIGCIARSFHGRISHDCPVLFLTTSSSSVAISTIAAAIYCLLVLYPIAVPYWGRHRYRGKKKWYKKRMTRISLRPEAAPVESESDLPLLSEDRAGRTMSIAKYETHARRVSWAISKKQVVLLPTWRLIDKLYARTAYNAAWTICMLSLDTAVYKIHNFH